MKKIKVKRNKPVYLGLSILEISKILCMNFDMIMLKQGIKTMQNYATWIQTAVLFISKLRIFMKILQTMYVEKRFDRSNYDYYIIHGDRIDER